MLLKETAEWYTEKSFTTKTHYTMGNPASTNTNPKTAKVTLLKKALIIGLVIIIIGGALLLLTPAPANDAPEGASTNERLLDARDEDSDSDRMTAPENTAPNAEATESATTGAGTSVGGSAEIGAMGEAEIAE